MQKLVSGYAKFRRDIFPQKRAMFEKLAGEQHPRALFVTCADSRILPSMITQADPGELFICRNAGNIVPPYGERMGGVSATIEYGVMVLGVEDIIVCGHTDCGAMRAVMHPEKVTSMPTVASWLHHADVARHVVEQTYPQMNEAQKLRALIEENVMSQIDHLKTHPSVAAKLRRGELRLHGWVYEIHTGDIVTYDPEQHQFVRLDPDNLTSASDNHPVGRLVDAQTDSLQAV